MKSIFSKQEIWGYAGLYFKATNCHIEQGSSVFVFCIFNQCGGKNIRFTVMNNLLPSTVKLHEKYDMKGSTYKRKASKHERAKKSPTLKDLDFMENHPEGLSMEKDTYDALIKTLQRDTRVGLTHTHSLYPIP